MFSPKRATHKGLKDLRKKAERFNNAPTPKNPTRKAFQQELTEGFSKDTIFDWYHRRLSAPSER